MKKFVSFLIIVAIIVLGFYAYFKFYQPAQAPTTLQPTTPISTIPTEEGLEELHNVITAGDETDCSKIADASAQKRCQFYFQEQQKEAAQAVEVTPEQQEQVQKLEMAVASGDSQDCSDISDPAVKKRCDFYYQQQEASAAPAQPVAPEQQAEEQAQADEFQQAIDSGNASSCDSLTDAALQKRCQFYYQQAN